MNTKLPELLAPAGNMERLITAIDYGADAVYVGAQSMSLRNFADNFTVEQLKEGCDYAHAHGGKVYVACNAFAHDKDLDELPGLLKQLQSTGADALIVNDPGVIRMARRCVPDVPLHLSTQANTLNTEAALFWHEQGVERIVLARELSIAEIKQMRSKLPQSLELEMFIHGAMCISYSGRCLLSNYLNGRDSNRGECAQPCRWKYEIREKGSNGEFFTMEQDEKGTFIMNSRDLRLIEYLPEVIDAGIMSLKIEGRMKSIAYVATVVNAYRMALDEYSRSQELGIPYKVPELVMKELELASHRPYTTGFAFGEPGPGGQETGAGGYISDGAIAAVVQAYDAESKIATIAQRNKFVDGEELMILSPWDIGRSFTVKGMKNTDGEAVESAPHPKEKLYIGCDQPVRPGDILRKKVE
ncbi:MAG: U32 family peptidase [Clostridia bacterium]|nr:U32 family peptidase [Clostridia bacterium]